VIPAAVGRSPPWGSRVRVLLFFWPLWLIGWLLPPVCSSPSKPSSALSPPAGSSRVGPFAGCVSDRRVSSCNVAGWLAPSPDGLGTMPSATQLSAGGNWRGSYFLLRSSESTWASLAISSSLVQHSMQMPTEPFGPRIMTNTGIPHNSFFLLTWQPSSGSASSHSTSRARSSVVRFFFCFLTWGRGRGPRASAVRLTSP
jgi:hypothetical protein